jgi:citrate lyase subunit beta/citryl-CoA lyase
MSIKEAPVLLRSLLFVPATRPDRFDKAVASGADAVIVDLEDAVEPGRKVEARQHVVPWFTARADGAAAAGGRQPLCLLRVNGARTSWFDGDLELAGDLRGVDGIVLPKCESTLEVEAVARAFPAAKLLLLIETARGVLNAPAIAAGHHNVLALIFGAEDLTADIGVPRTREGDEVLVARSLVVLAAVAAGVHAIDAVVVDIHNRDRLREDARRGRMLGYAGKQAIHPSQIPVIHEAFTPTADEVAAARRIVDASDAAAAGGDGAFRLDDRMVDAPVVTRARRVLDLARLAKEPRARSEPEP